MMNAPTAQERLARYAGATVLALLIALLALLSPTPALAASVHAVDTSVHVSGGPGR